MSLVHFFALLALSGLTRHFLIPPLSALPRKYGCRPGTPIGISCLAIRQSNQRRYDDVHSDCFEISTGEAKTVLLDFRPI